MKSLTTCALAALLSAASMAAVADGPLKPPRLYTGNHPPVHKSSSFAPHPTGRRVYGTPIQSPILKMQPKKPAH